VSRSPLIRSSIKDMDSLPVHLRRVVAITIQLVLVMVSNWLSFMLRFDGSVPSWAAGAFWQMLPWLLMIRALVFAPFRLYQGLWRYTSLYDLQALVGGVGASSLLFYVLVQSPLGPEVYPRSIFIIDALLLTLLLGGLRLTHRLYAEFNRTRPGKRVLVFGAGDAGELIVRDMKNNPSYDLRPIGFVDDDRAKVGRRIHGVPVLGTRQDLPAILERHAPDEVLIAMPSAEPRTV
jgi:FlaA1/EpsC-like NDP-sugar epimerase